VTAGLPAAAGDLLIARLTIPVGDNYNYLLTTITIAGSAGGPSDLSDQLSPEILLLPPCR
jgi:hypothetical protein